MRQPKSRRTTLLIALVCSFLGAGGAVAADSTWPREIGTEKGVLTIYQPQPEKFEDNVLDGRAAISMLPKGKSEPIFGVMWFTAKVDTDRDAGTALIRDIPGCNRGCRYRFHANHVHAIYPD